MLFVVTAILAAVFLGIRLTKDLFPYPIKKWVCKLAVSNWMRSQPQKFGREIDLHSMKTTDDIAVVTNEQELAVEKPLQTISSMVRDEYVIYGTDETGDGISVKLTRFSSNVTQADIFMSLKGETYHASLHGESLAHEFALGNLRLEMVDAFRVWRLWYNGIMTQSSHQSEDDKVVHVIFNFLWKALDGPLDNRRNGNDNLLAEHLCRKGLFGEKFSTLTKVVPEGYSQFGTLHGNVTIQSNDDKADGAEQQLYLYGYRTRTVISSMGLEMLDAFTGSMPLNSKQSQTSLSMRDDTKRLEFFAVCEDGNAFRLNAFNDDWTDGRILWASYSVTLVENIDCSATELYRDESIPKLLNIYGSQQALRVEIWQVMKTLQLSDTYSEITYLKMSINGRNANGILIRHSDEVDSARKTGYAGGKCLEARLENVPPSSVSSFLYGPSTHTCDGEKEYLLDFSHVDCRKVPLVGGKGASLAKLQTFSEKQSYHKVKTARGFCISTHLFRETVELEKFTEIFAIVAGNDQALETACSKVMEMIKSSDAAARVAPLISQRIEKIFGGENRNKIRFAVRSSGVLEDGSDLSCAGQNETFLGVSEANVAQKVVECWASLFTSQSVLYRLNHGQPAVSEMGVVIQEMVDATTAGVIFTADPRTGNPFQMIITANYGLGESVVSGSCDPDTITLVRHGDRHPGKTRSNGEKCVATSSGKKRFIASKTNKKWWQDVTVGRKVMGEKKTKIIYTTTGTEKDGNSTAEISMAAQESQQFCLDEETAIRVGDVAAEIELFMGHHKPVDIEWAIDQSGQIFILQCRNITALDAWTDFELLHELDAPVRVKAELFTTANAGEVLPKAIHTVGQTASRVLDFVCQMMLHGRKGEKFIPSPYAHSACVLFQQRLFISMFPTLYGTPEKEISTAIVCLDQTIFGRQVINEEIRQMAVQRFGIPSGMSKVKDLLLQIKSFMTFKSALKKVEQKYKTFELNYSHIPRKSVDVYRQITQDLIHIFYACDSHLKTTSVNTSSQFFLFLFLSEGKKPSEWSTSLFEDASRLLSVFANVESAEMPEDMDELGDKIVTHGEKVEEFLQAPVEKALEWLEGNEKVKKALDLFFDKHGHRGFSELDIGEPSWKSNPISFLPILRSVVKNKLNHKTEIRAKVKSSHTNDDELLDSLSTSLKPMTRRLLKLILPTSRSAVACRETSKSILVRVMDQFKQKYAYLAAIMVEEHLLPSATLITHLTHVEIGQLVNGDTSTSIILQKAMKRQKMYPKMEKLEFPEICSGLPEALDTSAPVTITNTIQATPVSRGIARGIAKVCLTVEEASENIRPGDILITHGTDIAWSPFFPLLGGVVTELGGLISHGAVVAREYGLPCIVGAINATKIFKTGDHVLLDAGKGTLSKTEE